VGGVGTGAQGGPLALRSHCSADGHLCILGMVACLSNGYCQEEVKQSTEIGLLRYNRSDSYDSHGCYEGACWPTPAKSGDTGRNEVGGPSPLEFGMLFLPSLPTWT